MSRMSRSGKAHKVRWIFLKLEKSILQKPVEIEKKKFQIFSSGNNIYIYVKVRTKKVAV